MNVKLMTSVVKAIASNQVFFETIDDIKAKRKIEQDIDNLTHCERLKVRAFCAMKGLKMPPNLFYDYDLQCEIKEREV